MAVLYVVGCFVEPVNVLQVGEFDLGGVLGPIVAVGDDKLRTGGGQRGDLGVVGLVLARPMDGHRAFASAAPEEVSGYLADRDADGQTVVDGGEDEGLGATAGAARHADAGGIDVFHGAEKIE